MAKGHVIYDDDGEIFEEDATVGRGVPRDPAGQQEWVPLVPEPPTEALCDVVKKALEEFQKTE
uniref:Uncharacterized protein n=1 Tax=Trypanosoma vivax (strain Y486) TaxID=1055687 RepID=G0U5G0_TRYVY|nr:hypothetical protein TVY486_1001630 [Trypanosoma vivax Y486]